MIKITHQILDGRFVIRCHVGDQILTSPLFAPDISLLILGEQTKISPI